MVVEATATTIRMAIMVWLRPNRGVGTISFSHKKISGSPSTFEVNAILEPSPLIEGSQSLAVLLVSCVSSELP